MQAGISRPNCRNQLRRVGIKPDTLRGAFFDIMGANGFDRRHRLLVACRGLITLPRYQGGRKPTANEQIPEGLSMDDASALTCDALTVA